MTTNRNTNTSGSQLQPGGKTGAHPALVSSEGGLATHTWVINNNDNNEWFQFLDIPLQLLVGSDKCTSFHTKFILRASPFIPSSYWVHISSYQVHTECISVHTSLRCRRSLASTHRRCSTHAALSFHSLTLRVLHVTRHPLSHTHDLNHNFTPSPPPSYVLPIPTDSH